MAESATWAAWYAGDLQGVYALLVVPAIFLAYLLLLGRRGAGSGVRRFMFLYCLAFTLETLLDPIATGLLVRNAAPLAATAVSLLFVLLGDFRVLLLVFLCCGELDGRRAVTRAALFTLPVPLLAFLTNAALDALAGPVSGQVLWLSHELLFVVLALGLLAHFGSDPFVRGALLYVVAYYALWASSDVLILQGFDLAWLLRAVPNQLYYSFWTPFVWFLARAWPPVLPR
jgi:hypothetical protein